MRSHRALHLVAERDLPPRSADPTAGLLALLAGIGIGVMWGAVLTVLILKMNGVM